MSDLTVTAAQVGLVDPQKAITYTLVAGATITKGQACYIDSNGAAQLADATTAGGAPIQARGIALNAATAGQAVTIVKRGALYGYTLSGMDYDAIVYLSETAGALADSTPAGTGTTVPVGLVQGMTDKDKTKVLYADFRWREDWS